MATGALLGKLESHGDLSDGDRGVVSDLAGAARMVARHGAIRRENEDVVGAFLLVEGWVSSSTMRRDGGVFISRFHLPGDLMGVASLGHAGACETLTALSPVTFVPVSKQQICALFGSSPRLAALLFVDAMRDAVGLTDRMASVARSSAESKIAALLMHLYDRACAIDPAQANALDFPLTQEEMGDALGLTSVHVSRTMRTFIDRAWLRRGPRSLIVRNPAALRAVAGIPCRTIDSGNGWLPAAG